MNGEIHREQPLFQLERSARKQEIERAWFRSDRVFLHSEDCWYFRTREGVEMGPYASRFEAEVEASLLREMIKDLDDDGLKLKVIREFVLDSFASGHELTPRYTNFSLLNNKSAAAEA